MNLSWSMNRMDISACSGKVFVEFDELPEVTDRVLDFPTIFRRFLGQVIAGMQKTS